MNAAFLNFAAQSPIIELHLSVLDKVQSDNNNQNVFFICKSALKSCSINITNNSAMCNLCIDRSEKAVEKFNLKQKAQILYLSKKDLDNSYSNFNKIIDAKTRFNIELGVRSSIASHVRIDQLEMLSPKWKKYYLRMLDSSMKLYAYFIEKFDNQKIENITLFNGRFSCARPVVEAAKKSKINYYLFDTILQKRPVVVKNNMLHNLEIAKRNAIYSYLQNINESVKISEIYMYSKMNKISVNDKVYTGKQTLNYIDQNVLNSTKPIISIFTSSDDEYRYIGADWENYPIVSQVESIEKLVKSDLSDKYLFVVRMHPNQQFMSSANTQEYFKLRKYKELLILAPESETDTYQLINSSNIVINFCSSVGIEANYLRKPVIQIGPSSFRLLPAANYVSSVNEAIDFILNKKYKLMPLRASLIWFTYLSKYEYNLPKFKCIENGKWSYDNEIIISSLYYRLLSIPSKLYVNIIKSNFTFLTRFPLYISNLLKNKHKV
jgi:hypothetical protein